MQTAAMFRCSSFLISRYIIWRDLTKEYYNDYNAARALIKMANASMEKESFSEFRQQVFSLTHLFVANDITINKDFKGTGIG